MVFNLLVKQVGFEPTTPEGNGVTARRRNQSRHLLHNFLNSKNLASRMGVEPILLP